SPAPPAPRAAGPLELGAQLREQRLLGGSQLRPAHALLERRPDLFRGHTLGQRDRAAARRREGGSGVRSSRLRSLGGVQRRAVAGSPPSLAPAPRVSAA